MTNLAEAIQNACEIARQDERKKFKEFLEKKENEFLKCTREDFLGRHFDVCGTLINEIINELFPEQEQDNSDREE